MTTRLLRVLRKNVKKAWWVLNLKHTFCASPLCVLKESFFCSAAYSSNGRGSSNVMWTEAGVILAYITKVCAKRGNSILSRVWHNASRSLKSPRGYFGLISLRFLAICIELAATWFDVGWRWFRAMGDSWHARASGLRHRHPELTRAIYNKANNRRARYIYISRAERECALCRSQNKTHYIAALLNQRGSAENAFLYLQIPT